MHVFVLGATGFIGTAVVRALIQRGHRLTGLTRSETSAVKLRSAGCQPLMGDIGRPTSWIDQLPPVDAVVHTACDVNTDMGAVDRRLLDALLARLAARSNKTRFVYTGGGWLFGPTRDGLATEETPFAPLPAFAWMVPHSQRVLAAPGIEGIVIHPAMVYTLTVASSAALPALRASALQFAWWEARMCAGRWCIVTILPSVTLWHLPSRLQVRAISALQSMDSRSAGSRVPSRDASVC